MALYRNEEQEPGAGESTLEIPRAQDQYPSLVGRYFALAFGVFIAGGVMAGLLYMFGGNVIAAALAGYCLFLLYFIVYSVFALYHLYMWGTSHDASRLMVLIYILGTAVIITATLILLATADWSKPLQATIFVH